MKQTNLTPAFYADAQMVKSDSLMPEMKFMSYNSSVVVVTDPITGLNHAVNFCSDNYGFIHTKNLFPILEAEFVNSQLDVEADYLDVNLSKFYVNYKFNNPVRTAGETLLPVAMAQHSYNGKSTYGLDLGFVREVNGQKLWGVGGDRISLSHSGGNVEPIIEGTVAAVSMFVENYKEAAKLLKKLDNQKVVSAEARIAEIVEEAGFYKSMEEDLLSIVSAELNNRKLNDLTIYFAFNQLLFGSPKIGAQMENRVKMDKKVFEALYGGPVPVFVGVEEDEVEA